ncbi:DUF871 domain-containing protein [Jeotgalibaca ciconiae]|uniref:DUF871 domain-containing protein n=1 Tax=Jeotgalibaca ciconiae TaxID=2496265 RepID=A0A3Q9BKE5_9LACT|nr:MupG family TIM beta-alpha barrel fold protein [Jeotgalibaca ciconiae]AZP04419.1 DUF871 domain-containing protein [Jeotgalibaca ciconiae]HJB24426.1 DUF871 family protein [Candidatus Jeotgalibaca pullicola]
MKREIGISIYPDQSDPEEDKKYLKKAASLGFQRLFISMLEVSEGKEAVKKKFQQIIQYSSDLGFEVILDVAPNIFSDLEVSYDDLSFFHELGAHGIRLDVGFDGFKESLLTYNEYGLTIELNMSNNVAYLDNILSYQANRSALYGCHNFYPQVGTALPYDFFMECSKRFKQQGLRTAAFVTSGTGHQGPWDVNDGLPTLEMHRRLPIVTQVKHLFATNLIDTVIIGNAYASEEELEAVAAINRIQVEFDFEYMEEATPLEKAILEEEQHYRRGDITDEMIRSTQVRVKYADQSNPPREHEGEFQRGDIVLGNEQFGKYQNELQIVLKPHKDLRKNLVGRIKEQELMLLDYIQPWSKFRLKNTK